MIEVTRMAKDRLSQEIWTFDVLSRTGEETVQVVLRRYTMETRESTRKHLFRVWNAYDRLSRCIFVQNSVIEKPEYVPMPNDVRDEAIAAVKIEFKIKLER